MPYLSYILSVVVVIVAISYFLLLFSENFITLFFAKFCIMILHVRVTNKYSCNLKKTLKRDREKSYVRCSTAAFCSASLLLHSVTTAYGYLG